MKPLQLFWSRGHERNAGDWYSPLICERLSGRRIAYADPRQCDLVAAGSLLGRLDKSHRLHRLGVRRRLEHLNRIDVEEAAEHLVHGDQRRRRTAGQVQEPPPIHGLSCHMLLLLMNAR